MKFNDPLGLRIGPHCKPNIVLLLTSFIIGPGPQVLAQSEYGGDGVPTALEEEIRWRVNRGRFDSAGENQFRGTSYADIPATAGPLAPHESLTIAARHHSEDMARNNIFQHDTIPGSFYYDPVTQPSPWDRLRAEGYFYNGAGENIAAGYSDAERAYVGWWNSTGHRKNMYNAGLREIGNGYFYWSSSDYRRYYTMDLGRINGDVFYTGTLFEDVNGDGIYDSGEGVPGIAVKLQVGGSMHNHYDVSSEVGSFAVPDAGIPSGSTVTVVLSNATANVVTLHLPVDYSTLQEVTLAANQEVVYGTYHKPEGSVNSGLRNTSPAPTAPTPTELRIAFSGTSIELSWDSEAAFQYQPQASFDSQTWTNLTVTPLDGTGATLSYTDSGMGVGRKLYRLLITNP